MKVNDDRLVVSALTRDLVDVVTTSALSKQREQIKKTLTLSLTHSLTLFLLLCN